ncbi:MAG: VanZ family protein [Nitrospiraceae bacterium]
MWNARAGSAELAMGSGGRWAYWLPVAAYAGLIFYLSSQSHPEEWLPSLVRELSDQALHLIEYGILGILCHRAFRHAAGAWATRYAVLLAVLASSGYGLTDEVHQAFVPLREASGGDVLMDVIGATVGAWGWRWTADTEAFPHHA